MTLNYDSGIPGSTPQLIPLPLGATNWKRGMRFIDGVSGDAGTVKSGKTDMQGWVRVAFDNGCCPLLMHVSRMIAAQVTV